MNNFKFYTFENREGNKYLYSGFTNLILEYSDRVKNFLETENNTDDELKGYLYGPLENETEYSPPVKPFFSSILLFITNQCNLACSYCYERANNLHNCERMDVNTVKNTILLFIKNFEYSNKIGITFFGGEPLFNLSLIEDSIKALNDVAQNYDLQFNYSLTTNGTILNDDVINLLLKYKINTQVSIDSNQKIHDSCRKFHNGLGSYNLIIDNVEKLSKYKDVSARVTLIDLGIDLINMYKELVNAGFSTVAVECVANKDFVIDNEDVIKFGDNLKSFADYFIDQIKQKRIVYFKDFLVKLKEIHIGNQARNYPCNSGLSQFSVATDGSIYFCHRFNNVPEFALGNIHTGFDNEKWMNLINNFQVSVRGKGLCGECWAERLCGGNCYYTSYIETGSATSIGNIFCGIRKKIYEMVLYIYTSLNEEEKLFLDNTE